MNRRWVVASWLAAAGVFLVIATTTSVQQSQGSPVPSVDNPGPQGAKVLFTWLGLAGFDVRAWHAPLLELPRDVATIVIAEPRARSLTSREVAALEAWVRKGGWLLYLASRTTRSQGALEGNFHFAFDESLARRFGSFTAEDETMAARTDGLMSGVPALSINTSERWAHESFSTDDSCFDAAETLCERALDRGRLLFAVGADLAENHRLQSAGNAQWWANLASHGPVLFDEFHHHPEPGTLPLALWLVLAQLALLGLVAAVSAGVRMGAPRSRETEPTGPATPESTRLAVRLRRARMAGPMLAEARAAFFARARDAFGLSASLPKAELIEAIADRCGISPSQLGAWDAACEARSQRASDREYFRLTRDLAEFESHLSSPTLN